MLLQTRDRVAQRPGAPLLLRAVARRVIAGGMRARAVGHQLDERCTAALAGALRRPLGHGVHREKVVAVDADPRNAVAGPALRECAVLAAGESLEGGDRALAVDH